MPNIVEIIKMAAVEAVDASNPVAIVFGEIVSISPLKINIEQRLILDESHLILSRNVTDYKTKISFDNPGIKQVFTTWDMGETVESSPSKITFKTKTKHDITVYNALKLNETVIMLQVQGGQKYIVLDRVG